jgi:serine protease Do
MSRLAAWGIGLASLLACGASVLAPAATASGDKDAEEIKRVHKRVAVVHGAGGYLGVQLRDVAAGDVAKLKLGEERGAVVEDVTEGGPADKAGVKEGDVIVRYQGQPVESVAQLVRLVRETPAGRKVAVEVSREGAAHKLQATLDERRSDWKVGELELPEMPDVSRMFEGARGMKLHDLAWRFDRGPRKLGIEYQEIEGQLARYFKLEERGILVTEVDEDGPAAKAGLKVGDVILEVDGRAVQDAEDLRREVRKLDPGQEAALTVQRDGRAMDLKLTVGGREPRRERELEGSST